MQTSECTRKWVATHLRSCRSTKGLVHDQKKMLYFKGISYFITNSFRPYPSKNHSVFILNENGRNFTLSKKFLYFSRAVALPLLQRANTCGSPPRGHPLAGAFSGLHHLPSNGPQTTKNWNENHTCTLL